MALLYMDAVITPNRSLSRKGFYWLIGVLVAFNLLIGVFMLMFKAFPVPVFLGLDVVGVLLAFRASYRGAGQSERVRVSADEVTVSHQIGASARTIWTSPTAFTRVSVEAPDEHEARVRLHLSGKALTIARALSPHERVRFAEALEAAIRKARAERH
ncbi:MAG: DUF2244 domain-containing protein [Caulobacteraceae bacterium]|nr:DUF2244 domain-containing protein [Caulobacteraceae bacterium]